MQVFEVVTRCVAAMQGEEKDVRVDKDDGIREGVTAKALGALKPVFKRNGTTTAGNSSQVCCSARTVCRSAVLAPFCKRVVRSRR